MYHRVSKGAPGWVSGVKLLVVFTFMAALTTSPFEGQAGGQGAGQKRIDPQAWGGNHVGRPIPDYVHGDECLFCHRNDIGSTWQRNAHGVTVRQREDAPELTGMLESQPALANVAKEIEYFLGSRHRVRFLKKEGYGKFAILNTQAIISEYGGEYGPVRTPERSPERRSARIIDGERPVWDRDKFAARCAGCHTTAVDPATKAFSAFGLDCFTCHGDVDLNHSQDISLVLLSKRRRSDAKVITSLCAQCHLREAKSRSTGLPYPNNFIAGDNLFLDFEVGWEKADDEGLNAGDRHIWRNARDVSLYGKESITCLNCHQVHGSSSLKHRRLLRSPICSECHQGEGFKNVKPYRVRSGLCEY